MDPHLGPHGKIWLNVGSGTHNAPKPWWNVDVVRRVGPGITAIDTVDPDQIIDPDKPLPFDDDSCERVFMSHVLEHIPWEAVPDILTDVRRVAMAELVIVGPDAYRTIEAYRMGQEPWSLLASVLEHKDYPDDMREWPGAPHHWNCVSGDTEFITDMGVRRIGEAVGESVRVLASPRGERGAWHPASIRAFGRQKTYRVRLTRAGRDHEIRATADHRWFIRSGQVRLARTTATLEPGVVLSSCHGHLPGNVRPSAVGIAAGITFGDGTAWSNQQSSPAEVTLCGEKDAELLKWFPLSPTRERPGIGITVCDLPRSWRALPAMTESLSYLYGWFLGYLAADGNVSKVGAISLASARLEHITAARDVGLRLGLPYGYISTNHRSTEFGPGPLYEWRLPVGAIEPDHFLLEAHRRNARQRSFAATGWRVTEVVEHEVEDVYCAVEPTTHSFTLAESILTGNCHEARVMEALNRTGWHALPILNMDILGEWPVVNYNPRWQFAIIARSDGRSLEGR